jgi:hypothetical protein
MKGNSKVGDWKPSVKTELMPDENVYLYKVSKGFRNFKYGTSYKVLFFILITLKTIWLYKVKKMQCIMKFIIYLEVKYKVTMLYRPVEGQWRML